MAPAWTNSASKHGVDRRDAMYALVYPNYVRDIEDNGDGTVNRLYIGPEHAQTTRELEVIVRVAVDGSGREAVIFHVMQLGPAIRRFREENPE
ncbi:hypothetical protein [Plantibacter sp. RU18]|uniref:hypothetical protein n=1 Tax=Plantibacter sp. RU18 TaxID=3158143 RepID=UPI003D36E03D